MMIRSRQCSGISSAGFTLIEILVTVIIIAIGLLGLAGLQMTTLNNQFEAYQRSQAVLLIEDMANRIRVNSQAATVGWVEGAGLGGYTVGTGYGRNTAADCSLLGTVAERDLCEWNVALGGSSVQLSGADLGSIEGAWGCIENRAGSDDDEVVIRVIVAWQGRAATIAPPEDVTCGQGQFGDDDNFRRAAYLDVVLARLDSL